MFINNNPLVLVGRKTLEPNKLTELIALMKTQTSEGGDLPGFGATGHLATSLLAQEAKVKIDLIPYRGAAPALQDIARRACRSVLRHAAVRRPAGQSRTDEGLRHHCQGEVAATSDCRKLGRKRFGPKLEILYWQALFAPGGTPEAVDQQAQCRVAGDRCPIRRSSRRGPTPGLRALSARSSARWPPHDAHAQERDRALGPGRPRQQYPGDSSE